MFQSLARTVIGPHGRSKVVPYFLHRSLRASPPTRVWREASGNKQSFILSNSSLVCLGGTSRSPCFADSKLKRTPKRIASLKGLFAVPVLELYLHLEFREIGSSSICAHTPEQAL